MKALAEPQFALPFASWSLRAAVGAPGAVHWVAPLPFGRAVVRAPLMAASSRNSQGRSSLVVGGPAYVWQSDYPLRCYLAVFTCCAYDVAETATFLTKLAGTGDDPFPGALVEVTVGMATRKR
jgi:hypothetical protein